MIKWINIRFLACFIVEETENGALLISRKEEEKEWGKRNEKGRKNI